MKTFNKTVIATAMLAALPSAFAADAPPVTANVGLTTNYVWRGWSQSAESIALQGGFDYAHASGFYLGTWGSNVNFADSSPSADAWERAQLEVDLYGGYKFKGAGIDWDVGVLHYNYPGAASALKYNFTEFYVGGGYGPVSAKYSYTSDYTGDLAATDKESASYLEVNYSQELAKGLTLGLHAGRSFGDYFDATGQKDQMDYKVSLAKDLGGGFALTAAFVDTDAKDAYLIKKGAFANDGAFILTVSKSM